MNKNKSTQVILQERGYDFGSIDVDNHEGFYMYLEADQDDPNKHEKDKYILASVSADGDDVELYLWDNFQGVNRENFISSEEYANFIEERFNELWAEYQEGS